ncbi:hypothetical protein V8C42DRAFT_132893 [Trichoderma barbatum]
MSQRAPRDADIETAIICVEGSVYSTVTLLFDKIWDKDGDLFGSATLPRLDMYTIGRIGNHDILLALFRPMNMANEAFSNYLQSRYPALEFVILTGRCGGVPFINHGQDEILLGDVIISNTAFQNSLGRSHLDRAMPSPRR